MEKVFCGSAKIIQTKFGELTKVSFSQKDIDTLQANMVNGWINLVVKEKKTKIEGKATHYLEVDTYKKESVTGIINTHEVKLPESDLPF